MEGFPENFQGNFKLFWIRYFSLIKFKIHRIIELPSIETIL